MVGEKRRRVRIKARSGLTVHSLSDERYTPKRTNISEAKFATITQREREANIRVCCSPRWQHQQLPRHAQMHEKQNPTRKFDDDPLRTTTRAEDPSTTNRFSERGSIRGRQVALTENGRPGNRRATDESREITDDRLHLWQLRHEQTTASSRPIAGHSSPQR